jgi:hypothetical protein
VYHLPAHSTTVEGSWIPMAPSSAKIDRVAANMTSATQRIEDLIETSILF